MKGQLGEPSSPTRVIRSFRKYSPCVPLCQGRDARVHPKRVERLRATRAILSLVQKLAVLSITERDLTSLWGVSTKPLSHASRFDAEVRLTSWSRSNEARGGKYILRLFFFLGGRRWAVEVLLLLKRPLCERSIPELSVKKKKKKERKRKEREKKSNFPPTRLR